MTTTDTLALIGKLLWEVRPAWDYEGTKTVPILTPDGLFAGGAWPFDREPKWNLSPVRIAEDGEIVASEWEECDAVQLA